MMGLTESNLNTITKPVCCLSPCEVSCDSPCFQSLCAEDKQVSSSSPGYVPACSWVLGGRDRLTLCASQRAG